MTQRERKKLRKAIALIQESDSWDEGMEILCTLYNPKWKPPATTSTISVIEVLRQVQSEPGYNIGE